MINKGYQHYKQQSISTMTNGEMLILLYDEVVKRLKVAEYSLNNEDYNNFDAAILRCEEIIKYLSAILNKNYEISSQLYTLYEYFLHLLIRIKAGRNREIIEELKGRIIELRDTFKQADIISRNEK